ncbi:metal-dependent transcriptional regulator [Lolliginicoccus lacisalsi]|uniref:metal-dependent transcriptional regulator n=1 Tax=Lolliginicoccus lacisalsi TaxID=2742202 RepID=UPI002FD4E50D
MPHSHPRTRSSPDSSAPALSPAAEDYLKAIWSLCEWSDERVSAKMLAEKVGVSASTVSESIKKLSDQGLVDHARYGSIALTDAGKRAAISMVRRHRLIETFLVRELGYRWDEVHEEAEVLEHAVSDRLISRIDSKLGFPERDPHGDPIPSEDGAVSALDARPLSEHADGDGGVIARISDDDAQMLRYFESVGIQLDTRITIVERRDYAGTVCVQVGDDDTTVELGDIAAQAIWLGA